MRRTSVSGGIMKRKIHLVAVARAVVERQYAAIIILIEALVDICEGDAILQNVQRISAGPTEFETIAVPGERGVAPQIDSVGECRAIFERSRVGFIVVEVPAIV